MWTESDRSASTALIFPFASDRVFVVGLNAHRNKRDLSLEWEIRVIEREGEDQNGAGNCQRGWKLATGAFLAMLRPVAGDPGTGGIIYTAIFVPRGISFSRANATRRHGAGENAERG